MSFGLKTGLAAALAVVALLAVAPAAQADHQPYYGMSAKLSPGILVVGTSPAMGQASSTLARACAGLRDDESTSSRSEGRRSRLNGTVVPRWVSAHASIGLSDGEPTSSPRTAAWTRLAWAHVPFRVRCGAGDYWSRLTPSPLLAGVLEGGTAPCRAMNSRFEARCTRPLTWKRHPQRRDGTLPTRGG